MMYRNYVIAFFPTDPEMTTTTGDDDCDEEHGGGEGYGSKTHVLQLSHILLRVYAFSYKF